MTPYSLPLPTRLLALIATVPLAAAADLRPLSTDRPDVTESPHTVDAGHLQFEMEIANWSKDGRERDLTLGELNAKIGLTSSTDVQLVLPFYQHQRHGDDGFGDIQIRVKHNLWGNDDGPTALAVMPFIQLPTADDSLGSGEFEGGVIVPFGFEGPAGWSFGTQAELDLVAADHGGHQLAFLASATASHSITECTGGFVEMVGIASTSGGDDFEAYFNTGLTWLVTPTLQFDGGVRVGLTSASVDFSPFVGVSAKF
ncbi:transporter [Luteolibacter marinus]|uniref:transporter n=1 Tax=Luteolibacter marinus TaxID=2776705 RepID=UPI0018669A70|nr:transporter [Luteolibacter marinus]